MTVGEAPPCLTCSHVELREARVPGESVRTLNGKRRLVVCRRARDPLTGLAPELAQVERQVGLCGPRGLFWEQGAENVDEAVLLSDVDDDIPAPAVIEEEMPESEQEEFEEEFEDVE